MTTTFRTQRRRQQQPITLNPTTPPQPRSPLNLTALQLKLLVTNPNIATRRTNDGFYAAPAEVALSANLRAGFRCGAYTLSHEALGALNLSTREAWNRAATNMLDWDSDYRGVAVRTRPLSYLAGRRLPGVQISFEHSAPTAWLAHPQLFNTLFQHLSRIFGEEACFYAPSDDLLLAVGLSEERIDVETWLTRDLRPRPTLACRIYYRNGFPSVRGTDGSPLPHAGLLSSQYIAELRARRQAHQQVANPADSQEWRNVA